MYHVPSYTVCHIGSSQCQTNTDMNSHTQTPSTHVITIYHNPHPIINNIIIVIITTLVAIIFIMIVVIIFQSLFSYLQKPQARVCKYVFHMSLYGICMCVYTTDNRTSVVAHKDTPRCRSVGVVVVVYLPPPQYSIMSISLCKPLNPLLAPLSEVPWCAATKSDFICR